MLPNEDIFIAQAIERDLAIRRAELRGRIGLHDEGWSLGRAFRGLTRVSAQALPPAAAQPAAIAPATAPRLQQPAEEWITSLGGDGQILLPRQVRQRLGLKTLDRLSVRIEQDTITISPA